MLVLLDRSADSFEALQTVGAATRELLRPVEDWNKGEDQFLVLLITDQGGLATPSKDLESVRPTLSDIAVDIHEQLGDLSGIRFESHLEDAQRGEYFGGFWAACAHGLGAPEPASEPDKATPPRKFRH